VTTGSAHSRASGNPEHDFSAASGSPLPRGRADHVISIAGVTVVADCGGALYWPEEGLLVVSDLHLEKGSSFARRGVFLPPYDTAATLAKLGLLIARYAPRCMIALGDNFHDGGGADRLHDSDRGNLRALQRGVTGFGSPAIMILNPQSASAGASSPPWPWGRSPSDMSRRRRRRTARSPGICIQWRG